MRTSPKKGEVTKHTIKIKKSTLQQTIGSKVQSPHNAKEPAQQSKQALPRADGEQQAADSNKSKLTKEVMPRKDDEKRLGVARTPKKLEEVGSSDALMKQQPKNLPLAYCSPYGIRLTKLDNKLSQDELLISKYVFGKVEDVDDRVSMATTKPREEVEMNVINIWSSIQNDRERKRDLATPSRLFLSCDQSYFFSKEMLKVNSFEKRYEDFKLVMDRELERCPWIKIKQVDLVRMMFSECP
ncbi:hypothetical protein Cgig2_013349 [Carnegiea gigantea]|uniref:Uncharacterized protein n=1 Tax=Carnegiea gigantea TaxID=171969 RepID=A0A9Q1JJJ3_9CARY|nr:hypothetical protein Cgig2_013349 [Carnegiea gigantea]